MINVCHVCFPEFFDARPFCVFIRKNIVIFKSKQQTFFFYNAVLHFFYCRFSAQDKLALKTDNERPEGNTCIISILHSMELTLIKKSSITDCIFHSKTNMLLFKLRTKLIFDIYFAFDRCCKYCTTLQ